MKLAVLALVALVHPNAMEEKVSLALNPKPGAPVEYEVVHDIEQELHVAGQRVELNFHIVQHIALTVREVPEKGPLSFELLYERVYGTIGGPLIGKIEFDSEHPKESYPKYFSSQVQQLLMLAGQTISLSVARDGTVEKVVGHREIYAGTEVGADLEKAGNPLDNESFRQEAQMFFVRLPGKAISEGGKWEHAVEVSLFSSAIELPTEYELEELAKDRATIGFFGSYFPGDGEAARGEEPEAVEAADSDEDELEGMVRRSRMSSASFQGRSVVSRQDGLPIVSSFERIVGAEVPNPHGEDFIPNLTADLMEIRRLDAGKTAGDSGK